MRPEVKALIAELMTGLIDEETFLRRAEEIGATDEELEEVM